MRSFTEKEVKNGDMPDVFTPLSARISVGILEV